MTAPYFLGSLGPTELVLILLVLVLLFGATKLPELARGSGRALRIFKAETKGLMDDDDDELKTPEQREVEARQAKASAQADAEAELAARQAELDAERERLRRGES